MRILLLLFLVLAGPGLDAESLSIVPKSDRAGDWALLNDTATLGDGELVLDGREERSLAIYKGRAWRDLTLTAKFRVDPAPSGVLACGFVFGATDSETYHYVHFDRAQAILVRSSPEKSWDEIKRVSGLNKPAGVWHEARVKVEGARIEVILNGKLLYVATDERLRAGHIGFYANQGVAHVKEIVVAGSAEESDQEFRRRPAMVRAVVKDSGAGGYEAFPDVCRLQDGRLMCVYYAGYGHVSLPSDAHPRGGRINTSFSTDEGRTWSESVVLYDGPHDDRDPSVAQLEDGTILCNFFSLRPVKRSGRPYEVVGSFLVSSQDEGKTWSEAQLISADHPCSAPVRTLRNGELILGVYGQDDGSAYGGVVKSADQGKTWSEVIRMDNQGAHLDAETDIIQLEDGSLYAALRGGKGAQMHWSRSRDHGASWTPCEPIGFAAHCPYFHRTADGTIILAHRLPATSLHYSRDECRTWSENIEVDPHRGAYPSMVDLKDGSVLIVFYEEGAGSNILARRFRTNAQGIEWLGFEDPMPQP